MEEKMSFQKMVTTKGGKYVELKVGHGNKIYLGGNETGYKVGTDGKIYTNSGGFVSKQSVEEFCKSQGLIKWFFDYTKKLAQRASFCFLIVL